jgi:hypothetical protein
MGARRIILMMHLDVIVSIDHGKGHSRITCDFMTRTRSENGEWNEDEHACTIGNARCKKDNAEIVQNTFGTLLNDDLKIITGWKHVSIVDGLATFGGHEVTPKMTPIEPFMAGDIPFCSLVIGKEGFATWWCCFCKLFKNDWQQAGHERGEPWTIEKLIEHAKKIENLEIDMRDVQAVCGVKGTGRLLMLCFCHILSHRCSMLSLAKATTSWTTL